MRPTTGQRVRTWAPRRQARRAALALAVALGFSVTVCQAAEHGLARPLFFFIGLQGEGAADTAQAMGLNALQIKLPADAPDRIDEIRAEIREAADKGLQVILQLPTNLGLEQRLELGYRDYWRKLEAYIRVVVPALRDEQGIVAWQTDDFLERAIHFSDAGFQSFLQERYGTLEALNDAWGTEFGDWRQIGQETVKQADGEQPWGIGVASVDLADWKAAVMREVMRRWAAMVRAYDRRRPLMTGRLSLYRTIASVPLDYDIVVPAMRPDVLEDDPVTGNVHAVDMCRRGGRFEVVPALHIALPPDPKFTEGRVVQWILEAAGHGARGFAIEDWERFVTFVHEGEQERRPLARREIRRRLAVLAGQIGPLTAPEIWHVKPRACYAFLWAPYAGGLEAFKVPAYGYLGGWSPREPSALFFAFRRGCQFGIADYLTVDDLAAVDLDRYGVIFAPHVLSVPEAAARALEEWVNAGGVLVADVGLGMYQTRDWKVLPSPLSAVFGLSQMVGGVRMRTNWQVVKGTELVPGLPPGVRAIGLVDVRRGPVPATERQPRAIDSWMTYAPQVPGVEPLAIAHVKPAPGGQGRLIAGIFSNTHGLGGGVFATFRLWGRWDPADPLFAAFHGALCSRRAQYALAGGFWPGGAAVVAEEDGAKIISVSGGTVELDALRVDDRLFAHAYCTTSAEIRLPDGRRAGDVHLVVEAPAMTLVPLEKLPVAVRPYERTCVSRVEVYGPRAIVLKLYGDRPAVLMTKAGLKMRGMNVVPVRVIVSDGRYKVAPGSEHKVRVKPRLGREQEFKVVADARGNIDFDVVADEARVEIEPVGR